MIQTKKVCFCLAILLLRLLETLKERCSALGYTSSEIKNDINPNGFILNPRPLFTHIFVAYRSQDQSSSRHKYVHHRHNHKEITTILKENSVSTLKICSLLERMQTFQGMTTERDQLPNEKQIWKTIAQVIN